MLKFLKMTVAEDVITTEEVLVVLVAEEVQLQEEKETLLQDVKVLVVDLEATEILHHVKVVLDQEVWEVRLVRFLELMSEWIASAPAAPRNDAMPPCLL